MYVRFIHTECSTVQTIVSYSMSNWGREEGSMRQISCQQNALTSVSVSHVLALIRKPVRQDSTTSSQILRPKICRKDVTLSKLKLLSH